jgi:hypothetical protein
MRLVASATLAIFAWSGVAGAQAPAPGAPPPPGAGAPPPGAPPPASGGASASADQTFSQQELEQLMAPIALYPDALLAQILMAATYPLDIVAADRWVKANPSLKDQALQDELQKHPWDPSVKSLAVFPQVLAMMSEKLDWTQKLGDAFLGQKEQVMATAQALRKKAVDSGNLKDSKEQKVITEKTETNTTIIKVEPANPEVVYVPTYNPTVVYGAWPYPAYPPYSYYPPGYAAGAAFWGFTAGVVVGAALWGGCNWGRGDVNVNVNKYNNFNRTNISNSNWNHNVDRRGSVPYKNDRVAQQYNRGGGQGAQARQQYRGREGGQQAGAGARPASYDSRGGGGSVDRGGGGGGSSFDRGGAGGSYDRGGGSSAAARNTAFDSGGGRASTTSASNRGASSMNARGGGGARAGGGGRGGRR